MRWMQRTRLHLRPAQEPTAPEPAHDHAAVARADESRRARRGRALGPLHAGMAEQMPPTASSSRVGFTLAILAWSDVGKTAFGCPLATPFGWTATSGCCC